MVQPEDDNYHENRGKMETGNRIEWSAKVITEVDNYHENREKMKTGDLILWRSNKWRWQLWRGITKSTKGNHVSTIIRLKEYEKRDTRVFILETSQISGAALNRLFRKLESFHGEVRWYPLADIYDCYREKIAEEMLNLVGEPYDTVGVLKETSWRLVGAKTTMFFKKIGKYLGLTWKCVRQGRWYEELFCSEYCYQGYLAMGVELKKKYEGSPLPAELLDLEIFQYNQGAGGEAGHGSEGGEKGILIYKGTSLWEILYRQFIRQEKISELPLFSTRSKHVRLPQ